VRTHARTHPHTQLFNGPLSKTTQVSLYQKKHSPTNTHEEEEGFTQTERSALSQQGLLDPIKPAYNQSQLAQTNSQSLKLTIDQYARSPGYSTYCNTSFTNFLHHCSPSSGFYGARKDNRGRCTDNPSGCHPIRTVGALPPLLRQMPVCRNPPNLSWLGTNM